MTVMALDTENGMGEVQLDKDTGQVDRTGLPIIDPPDNGVIIDAAADPAAINAITAAALADDEPEDFSIKGPPDGSCTLIAGYVNEDGTRYTSVELRELRGRDEEQLSRALVTGDLTRYIDAIVRSGVVSLGPLTDPREIEKALDTLLLGDRDLLCLQIRRMAYGDTSRLDVKCPFCDHEFQVDYSFSTDVPLKPFEVEGSDDLSLRLFDVDCPSGTRVRLRAVDGKAQKVVYTPDNAKKTEEELNTTLLRELIVSVDGTTIKGVGPVLDLTARDRRFLLKWLVDTQPGPQYQKVTQECPTCIKEFPLVMTLREMFRGD